MKSGNKKAFTYHFVLKQERCDIEHKWCDLNQK